MCLPPRKLVAQYFEKEQESFSNFLEKVYVCFMVSFYSTALINDRNIIEFF